MPIFEEKLDHIGLERSASCSCVLIDLSLSCFSVFLSFFSFILFFPRKVDSFFFSFFSSTLSSPSENSENYLSCFGAGGRVGTKGTQRGPSRTWKFWILLLSLSLLGIFAPPGFCVDVRGLEKPVGWGPEHLGERGAWRRVRRLHQLRPRLPQGLHCSHWHLWCDKVGSSVNNQCIGNLEFPNGECFIVGIQKHCFKLIDNVAQPSFHQERYPELLCCGNVSPRHGLPPSCE